MNPPPKAKRGQVRVTKSSIPRALRVEMRSEAGGTLLGDTLSGERAVGFMQDVVAQYADLLEPLPVKSKFLGYEAALATVTRDLDGAKRRLTTLITQVEEDLARENAFPDHQGRRPPDAPPVRLRNQEHLRELHIMLDTAGALRALLEVTEKASRHAVRPFCPRCQAFYLREKTSGIRLCPQCEGPVDAQGDN